VPPEAVRTTVFQQIPRERLQAQLQEAQQWLSGDTSAVFPLVMQRYSYLRQSLNLSQFVVAQKCAK